MPHRRFDWQGRVRDVGNEYLAARVGVDWLLGASPDEIHDVAEAEGRDDPPPGAGYDADRNLAATYVIRMSSVFESAVQSYWRQLPPRGIGDRPSAEELIDDVGDACAIATDLIQGAQGVRNLRNHLVHGRLHVYALSADVADARQRLLSYLNGLPVTWG